MPGAMDKLTSLETEVKDLRQEVGKFSREVVSALAKLEQKLNTLHLGGGAQSGSTGQTQQKCAAPVKKEEAKASKDDDDIDLFGSDEEEESEEAKKLREDRLHAYESKKAKKPTVVAKSMLILDVKPWDDETDVHEMEKRVRAIQADGLVWGTSTFKDVAFGIKKLQITAVVEDEKISVDWLEEQITGNEDLVQSMDIAAFNKI